MVKGFAACCMAGGAEMGVVMEGAGTCMASTGSGADAGSGVVALFISNTGNNDGWGAAVMLGCGVGDKAGAGGAMEAGNGAGAFRKPLAAGFGSGVGAGAMVDANMPAGGGAVIAAAAGIGAA